MAALRHSRPSANARRKTEPFGPGAKNVGRKAGLFRDLGVRGRERQAFPRPRRERSGNSHAAVGEGALQGARGEPAKRPSIGAVPGPRSYGLRYAPDAPQADSDS